MSLDKSNKQTLVTCQRCKEQTSLSDLNATIGKIFVHSVLRTYDIKTGAEGEKAI